MAANKVTDFKEEGDANEQLYQMWFEEGYNIYDEMVNGKTSHIGSNETFMYVYTTFCSNSFSTC